MHAHHPCTTARRRLSTKEMPAFVRWLSRLGKLILKPLKEGASSAIFHKELHWEFIRNHPLRSHASRAAEEQAVAEPPSSSATPSKASLPSRQTALFPPQAIIRPVGEPCATASSSPPPFNPPEGIRVCRRGGIFRDHVFLESGMSVG